MKRIAKFTWNPSNTIDGQVEGQALLRLRAEQQQ